MDVPLHDTAGAGPAVVFLHSFPLDRTMWASQRDAVAAAGCTAITVDLPGFGATPCARDTPCLETYARAVVALLDALTVERATVVGLSLGGYVALALWRLAPERVHALVLADTRAEADTPAVKAGRIINLNVVKKHGTVGILDRLIDGLVARETPAETRAAIRAMAARQDPDGVSYALLAMRDRPDATGVLPTITVPTLVLGGDQDTVTPPADMGRMAAAIPGAHHQVIPGAGHLSNLEQPMAFNTALVGFCRRR